MKKYALYTAIALVTTLASCEDTSDLGIMQINEELPRISVDCVTIAAGEAYSQAAWNLPALIEAETPAIKLVTTASTKELPEGAKITYGVEFAASEDFSSPIFRNLPETGDIAPIELDNIFRELFGMGPKPHTLYARYEALVNVNNQLSAVGTGEKVWQVVKSIEVTPVPKPMEERYFFLSDATNWNLGQESVFEMDHLDKNEYNIYDYPYFWIVVTTTADKTYCKIAPESANAEGNWDACIGAPNDGDVIKKGTLISGGGAFVIEGAGRYIVRFNAMESTVTVANATEALYTPGAGLNDWKPEKAFPLVTEDYVNYRGFSYLGTEFKLTVAPNWNFSDYGQGFESGYIEYMSNNGNIVPTMTDFVYMNVSTGSWKISYDSVSSIGIIGGFNDWASDVKMAHDATWQIWTGEVTIPSDKSLGFKFRLNEDWVHDFGAGAEAGQLKYKGSDINFPAAGTYIVTVNLSTVPYTYTVTAK